MSPPTAEVIRRAAAVYSGVERWTILLMMVALVLFSLYQIVLRNFFFTGIIWGDNLLRHLVLWIGFLGACRATAEGKHIQIELHTFIPEGLFGSVLRLVRIIFLAAVSAALNSLLVSGNHLPPELPGHDPAQPEPAPAKPSRLRAWSASVKSFCVLVLSLAALSGAPLFSVIAGASILAFLILRVDLSLVVIEMYRLASNPMLVALMLFALAGYMLAESNASKRLVRLSMALLGRAPGGLAIVALLTSAFFTALTGASGITIVALGGLLLPALVQDRYPEKFSLGLLTTCGSLGLLFPPSLPLIVYGMVAEVKISELFVAGILPGLLMMTLLALYSVWQGARKQRWSRPGERREPRGTMGEITVALREAVWELLLPVVVIGGIFSGFLAVSEAAAITVLYVFLVETVIHREVKLRALPPVILKTAVMVGAIVLILGASLAFNSFMVDQQVPSRILELMQDHVRSRTGFLIILNVFLLGVGCLLDMFSALVIVVPLIVPIAASYGIDLLHLGIIFLTNLQIGYSTPPVGMDLFIAGLRFEKPIVTLYVASLPFLAILLTTLAIITFFPSLSLVLVR